MQGELTKSTAARNSRRSSFDALPYPDKMMVHTQDRRTASRSLTSAMISTDREAPLVTNCPSASASIALYSLAICKASNPLAFHYCGACLCFRFSLRYSFSCHLCRTLKPLDRLPPFFRFQKFQTLLVYLSF